MLLTEREARWNIAGMAMTPVGFIVTLPPTMFSLGWPGLIFSGLGLLIAIGGLIIVISITVRMSRRSKVVSDAPMDVLNQTGDARALGLAQVARARRAAKNRGARP